MTKREELETRLLFEVQEIIFDQTEKASLLMEVDGFNGHIYWSIQDNRTSPYTYVACEDSQEAFNLYLKLIGEE